MSELPPALHDLALASAGQLRRAVAEFGNVCYANSLGMESSVLTGLIWSTVPEIEIFTVDTGRLFPETDDLIDRMQRRYGRTILIHYPDAGALAAVPALPAAHE